MAQIKKDEAVAETGAEVAVRSEPMSASDVAVRVAAFSGGQPMVYSTIQGDDFESKKAILNAVTDAEPVSDHIGETIMLKDFVIQGTTMIDDETGEERDIIRTILVSADGKAYAAVSDGLFKILQTFTGLIGHPSVWPAEGVGVKIEERKGRRGFRYMTLRLV